MKKLSPTQKRFYLLQAVRKSKHEIKRKKKRLRQKFLRIPQKVKAKRGRKFIQKPSKIHHEVCKAPSSFSLRRDVEVVIQYFEKARKVLTKSTPVYFDLSGITDMGPATLTFLCAWINENKFTGGTAFRGNAPDDPTLRDMFNKAGFYNFVRPEYPRNRYSNDIYGELTRVTREKVKPQLAGEVCKSAMKHTFDSEDYKNQNFYPILIECMANTRNHAGYGSRDISYNWWLLAYKEPNTKITKFCFLDLGIGIFGSLEKKYREKNLGTRLLYAFIPSNNVGTMTRIFQGERRTSTDLRERGLGLKNIYNLVKKDQTITNFTILSNDVISTIQYNTDDKVKKINGNFEGTMYYWELNPSI